MAGFFVAKVISPVSLVVLCTYQAPDLRSLVVLTNRLSEPLPERTPRDEGCGHPARGRLSAAATRPHHVRGVVLGHGLKLIHQRATLEPDLDLGALDDRQALGLNVHRGRHGGDLGGLGDRQALRGGDTQLAAAGLAGDGGLLGVDRQEGEGAKPAERMLGLQIETPWLSI
jgi:hypothetical protein